MTKPTIIQLVDSVDYVRINCFQHQLLSALRDRAHVRQVTLDQLKAEYLTTPVDRVVSCLKMRTAFRHMPALARYLNGRPLIHYEQDPWHGYMDDSPYKDFFSQLQQSVNLKFVAVTTRWWAQRLAFDGIPSKFVKMWMLPQYCDRGPAFAARPTRVGFVGSLHAHRRAFFDNLQKLGVGVTTSGGYNYQGYLRALHAIGIYVHSEDCPITVNGITYNLNDGLWAREVEVGARGCVSIRNWGIEHDSYLTPEMQNTYLYRTESEVPHIVETILTMPPSELQDRLDSTVNCIRDTDEWSATAQTLVES